MKHALFLTLSVVTVFGSLKKGHAALLPINPDPSSPYYADFNTTGLSVTYSFLGNNTGKFTITNTVAKGEHYTSGSSAAGTHGANNNFQGFYGITANVQNIGGEWQVTGGSFSVAGNLFGGATTDLLLSGTLLTGSQTFGFDSTLKELQFLFTTGSPGNSAIISDFFGSSTGHGGILLNYGTAVPPFSLTANWQNTGTGFADTFVPEPVFYPFAAAGVAMVGFVLVSRKSRRASMIVA